MKKNSKSAQTSKNKNSLGRAASALIRRNPLLTTGILIGPIVAAAVNLKAAVALSIAVFVIVIPPVIVAKILQNRIADWINAVISVVLSSALAFLAYHLVSPLSPLIFDVVGIYLPVLIIAPVSIVGPGRDRLASKSLPWCIAELVFLGAGFTIIACLIGLIRELLSNFSIWGVSLGNSANISAASTVFTGFIILGFISAIFRAFVIIEKRFLIWYRRYSAEKKAHRSTNLTAQSDSVNAETANIR